MDKDPSRWLNWSKVTSGGGGKTKRAGVIIVSGDEYLVIKQNEGLWGFPKGSMCFSDIDFTTPCDEENQHLALLKAASRELLEEVGVKLSTQELGKFPVIVVKYHRYFVAIVDKKPHINIDPAELSEYEWVTFDKFIMIDLDNLGAKKYAYEQSRLTTEAIIKAKLMIKKSED
jgi:8-oxo-dGTP pyrophosphatase MutT (NUDIX family)